MSLSVSGLSLPSAFQEEHLKLVASWMLEEYESTLDDLVRDTDSEYTIGTTSFGRQKARILKESRSENYPWLEFRNTTNDLVFSVDGIPCRFTNDNVVNPKKRAARETHCLQYSLLEDAAVSDDMRFVFVLDKEFFKDEPRVVLLGYSKETNTQVCSCVLRESSRRIGEANISLPDSVEIKKPLVSPKRKNADDDNLMPIES